MIKQITVAECDVCGKTEKAKQIPWQYNETEYVVPDGWKHGFGEMGICICAECAAKLGSVLDDRKGF